MPSNAGEIQQLNVSRVYLFGDLSYYIYLKMIFSIPSPDTFRKQERGLFLSSAPHPFGLVLSPKCLSVCFTSLHNNCEINRTGVATSFLNMESVRSRRALFIPPQCGNQTPPLPSCGSWTLHPSWQCYMLTSYFTGLSSLHRQFTHLKYCH